MINELYETLKSVVSENDIKAIDHIHISESDGDISFRFEYDENGYVEKSLILTKDVADEIVSLICDIRGLVKVNRITLSNMDYDLFTNEKEFYDIELTEIKDSELIFRKQDGNRMVVNNNNILNLEFVNFLTE